MILYGAPVREEIKKDLIERVKKLENKPVLAIVQVGDREDSNIYIRQKQKFGDEIGVKVLVYKLEKNISQEYLEGEIKKLNENESVSGIIMQLPLPEHLDSEKIIDLISIKKDTDGLSGGAVPATARGVLALLNFYKIPVEGKKVAVIGRSKLAGGPIAKVMEGRGGSVVVCHRNTENMPQVCRGADILISAAGKAGLVTKEFVKPGQVVIDVGINRIDGKIVGDVASSEVEPIVAHITPVPGGVGPLTVACLFQNLLDLCYTQSNL